MTPEDTAKIVDALERIADVMEFLVLNGLPICNTTYQTQDTHGKNKTKVIPFVIED